MMRGMTESKSALMEKRVVWYVIGTAAAFDGALWTVDQGIDGVRDGHVVFSRTNDGERETYEYWNVGLVRVTRGPAGTAG